MSSRKPLERVIDEPDPERNLYDAQNRAQDLQEHAQESLDMPGHEHDNQIQQHDRQQDDPDHEPTFQVRTKGKEYDHGGDAVGRHDRRQGKRRYRHVQCRDWNLVAGRGRWRRLQKGGAKRDEKKYQTACKSEVRQRNAVSAQGALAEDGSQ